MKLNKPQKVIMGVVQKLEKDEKIAINRGDGGRKLMSEQLKKWREFFRESK